MTSQPKGDHPPTGSLKNILFNLPESPGVYRYYDGSGNILYIGKAKNLKRRVLSYFNREHLNGKLAFMVKKIADVQYILVNSERDALLLENSLIKKHKPRYNVALKDDKTYPWICIKNELFPRIIITRRLVKDGSQYFGPYTSGWVMRIHLDLINKVFKPRTCNLNLDPDNIKKKKFRVCLEYHIGNCPGPCESHQTEEEYNQGIMRIKEILRGNTVAAIDEMKQQMALLASQYRFEEAHKIKEQINVLTSHRKKTTIVNPKLGDLDVISIITDNQSGFVNYLRVMDGAIVQSHNIEIKKKLGESPVQLLEIALIDCRQRFDSKSPEVIVPFNTEYQIDKCVFTIPRAGDRKKLLDLSLRNAKHFQLVCLRKSAGDKLLPAAKKMLTSAMADLNLSSLPVHIECFDNSNIQGEFPVSACVVFKYGVPSKQDYRLFNLRTVSGPDDFSSMHEAVFRRFSRQLNEKQTLPQLIVIDGGKGQLHAAADAIKKAGISGGVKIIGLAKRLEEVHLYGRDEPVRLDKRSETLKLLQHIRNEAHRFGLKHHRGRRIREVIKSELYSIKGVGERTVKILLSKFGSVEQLKKLSREDLVAAIGKSRATKIWDGLSSNPFIRSLPYPSSQAVH